jgi:hypothetical protein
MDPDDAPKRRPRTAKAVPAPLPTEEELSRIAREAVRQPPDPRLDKQLARMGLADTSGADVPPGPATEHPRGSGGELERLAKELWRVQVTLWVLVAAIGILAVMVVVLLFR